MQESDPDEALRVKRIIVLISGSLSFGFFALLAWVIFAETIPPIFSSGLVSLQSTASLPPTVTAELTAAYSRLLYGAPYRTPASNLALRVIWPKLLSPASQKALRGSVRCKVTQGDANSTYPYLDDRALLNGAALWLHHSTTAALADQRRVVASNGWIEATHCFYFNMGEQTAVDTPMWFFAAAGSGISINVGRTLALRASVFGDKTLRALHKVLRGASAASRPVLRTLRGKKVNAASGQKLVAKVLGPLMAGELKKKKKKGGGAAFAPPYDSVQFVYEKMPEAFAGEHFLQIVLLDEWATEMSFLASHLNRTDRIKCGRKPYLRPCTPADAAVRVHGPACTRPMPSELADDWGCPAPPPPSSPEESRYWNARTKVDMAKKEASRLSHELGVEV